MASLYKHILLAVDLLPYTDKLIEKSSQLAEATGAKITLLHAIEPDIAAEHIFVDQEEYHQTASEQAGQKLKGYADTLGKTLKAQQIEFGEPKLVILNAAEKLHCDLIILGSHGRHGLHELLGSTAHSVIHNAPCDVMIEKFNGATE